MGSVRKYKESVEKSFKVFILIFDDECFIDFSCAKNLNSKFQAHKAGKYYETAAWKNRTVWRDDCFTAYLLEETDKPVTRKEANNILLAWIKYYQVNGEYKVCNTELADLGTDLPVEAIKQYKRICNQKIEPTFIRDVSFDKKRHAPYTSRETDEYADMKQMNVRVASETKDRFYEFCDVNGMSPAKAIEYLLNLAEGSNSELLDLIASLETQIQEGKEKQRIVDNAEQRIRDSFRNGLIPKLQLYNERWTEFIWLYYEYFLRKNVERKVQVNRFYPSKAAKKYKYPEAAYGYTVLRIVGLECGRRKNLISVFGYDEKYNHLKFRYFSNKYFLGVPLWKAIYNNNCDVFFIAYEKAKNGVSTIVGALPIGIIPFQQKFKNEKELERQLFLSDIVDLIQGVDDSVNPDYPQDGISDGDDITWLNPKYYKRLRANKGISQIDDSSYSFDNVALEYFALHPKEEKGGSPFPMVKLDNCEDVFTVLEQAEENVDVLPDEEDAVTEEPDEIEAVPPEENSTGRKPALDDVIKKSEQQSINQDRNNRRKKL